MMLTIPFNLPEPKGILSISQLFTILSAVEDLETVTPRVYAQCEECFRSTLIEYHQSSRTGFGSNAFQTGNSSYVLPRSPRALLAKSVSSLTAESSFSLIGSDLIESARGPGRAAVESGGPASTTSSSGLHDHDEGWKRGWDWRAGLAEDVKGSDVLRLLRLGLARGLSLRALG